MWKWCGSPGGSVPRAAPFMYAGMLSSRTNSIACSWPRDVQTCVPSRSAGARPVVGGVPPGLRAGPDARTLGVDEDLGEPVDVVGIADALRRRAVAARVAG